MTVLVDSDLCNGCSLCADNCPQGVFELKNGKSNVIREEDCLKCHLCEVTCENKAITVEEG